MDYLQYPARNSGGGFYVVNEVLNLVINGLPSILLNMEEIKNQFFVCFKPCYKWITFNTWYQSTYHSGTTMF